LFPKNHFQNLEIMGIEKTPKKLLFTTFFSTHSRQDFEIQHIIKTNFIFFTCPPPGLVFFTKLGGMFI